MTDELRAKIVDAVAAIWRSIGQPDTEGFIFVVSMGSPYEHMESIMGIPVYVAASVQSPSGASIVLAGGDWPTSARFDKEAHLLDGVELEWAMQ